MLIPTLILLIAFFVFLNYRTNNSIQIFGQVTAEDTGTPLTDVRISLSSSQSNEEPVILAKTNGSGRYTIIAPANFDYNEILFLKNDYLSIAGTFDSSLPENEKLSVSMKPGTGQESIQISPATSVTSNGFLDRFPDLISSNKQKVNNDEFCYLSNLKIKDITTETESNGEEKITFKTTEPASVKVDWGENAKYNQIGTVESDNSKVSHSALFSPVIAGQFYHFSISAATAYDNLCLSSVTRVTDDGTVINPKFINSGDLTFQVSLPSITISNIQSSDITADSFTLSWDSSRPTKSTLFYSHLRNDTADQDPKDRQGVIVLDDLSTHHSIKVGNLLADIPDVDGRRTGSSYEIKITSKSDDGSPDVITNSIVTLLPFRISKFSSSPDQLKTPDYYSSSGLQVDAPKAKIDWEVTASAIDEGYIEYANYSIQQGYSHYSRWLNKKTMPIEAGVNHGTAVLDVAAGANCQSGFNYIASLNFRIKDRWYQFPDQNLIPKNYDANHYYNAFYPFSTSYINNGQFIKITSISPTPGIPLPEAGDFYTLSLTTDIPMIKSGILINQTANVPEISKMPNYCLSPTLSAPEFEVGTSFSFTLLKMPGFGLSPGFVTFQFLALNDIIIDNPEFVRIGQYPDQSCRTSCTDETPKSQVCQLQSNKWSCACPASCPQSKPPAANSDSLTVDSSTLTNSVIYSHLKIDKQDQAIKISYQAVPNQTKVEWGTIPGRYDHVQTSFSRDGQHGVVLRNLDSRTYHFRISAIGGGNRTYYSPDLTFAYGSTFDRFFADLWAKVFNIF